jgi:tetratricopeptide (TPR) repeat protein
MRRLRSRWPLPALALLAATTFVSARSVEDSAQRHAALRIQYLPSGAFLEKASVGYRTLASDVVWFLTVQYYGEARLRGMDYPLFEHLIDAALRLDPYFGYVYEFGSLIITEELGRFDEGMEMLERGMARLPEDWSLPFEAGFLHYVDARDYSRAGLFFEVAAKKPGAPDRARRFAAYVHDKAGHTVNSLRMWMDLHENTDNPHMRDLARRNIEELVEKLEREGKAVRVPIEDLDR